jgi:putative ABC transport system permease protein
MLSDLFFRLRALFARKAVEGELDDELRFHLEQQVDKYVKSGLTREEATRRTRLAFGGLDQVKEECREARGLHFIETLFQDVRYGMRMLRKHPSFTVVAVLTLALGIGANTAIFSVVNTVLLRPLPYPQSGRLVYLSEWSRDVPEMSISMANFADWRTMNTVFDSMVAFRADDVTLTGHGEPERLAIRQVTAGLFPTLGVPPILGRPLTAADDKPGAEPVVLLSDSLWARAFGRDTSVLGRRLDLDGELFTVIGVLPSSRFHTRWQKYDAFTSLGRLENMMGGPTRRDEHPGIYSYARLKPGVTVEQARAQMVGIAARLGKLYKADANNSVVVEPLLEGIIEDVREPLLVMMGAVGFVLLIACANVANLLTSRAIQRRREIAVRGALGASAIRLARQFLCESLLLALLGGALGLVVAYFTGGALIRMAASSLPRIQDTSIDRWVFAFALVVSLLTGIVFGVFPALAAYRGDPNEALKDSGRSTGIGLAHMRFRNFLAGAELAISLILLIGAGLAAKSLLRIVQADAGFRADGVIVGSFSLSDTTYKIPAQQRQFVEQLVEKVSALPGVMAAGFKSPLLGGAQAGFFLQGRPMPEPGKEPSAEVSRVTPGAMEAMGIRFLRGRPFNSGDNENSAKVCIIDDTLAEQSWPGEDPIGKQIGVGFGSGHHHDAQPPFMTVLGVVRRVKNYGVDQPSLPEIFVPNAQIPGSAGNLVVLSREDPEILIGATRQVMRSLDPNLPLYNVRTLHDIADENVAPHRLSVVLLGIFAGIALVLATLGIYGVMAYMVTGRTHEIGVRLALGATPGNVLGLVLGQGVRVAGTGVIAGVLASLVLTRLMKALLFGVSATDPVTFMAVAATLMLVALIACYIPARAAMALDPTTALRRE